MPFIHELPDSQQLFEAVAKEKGIIPLLVEKDYWLMHCLWGLKQQDYTFELKGGTSLSKGFNIIDRFSEDIDTQIHPKENQKVATGKNQDKKAQIESRRQYFDSIANELKIDGLSFERDPTFDDEKMRSAGISGKYPSHFSSIEGVKSGIVLELGFDQTTPNELCDISSWALDKALSLDIDVIDNRAKKIKCYCPEYTFVEKLQTISTKYRKQQEEKIMPINFLRHYYDIYQLLNQQRILDFIGTEAYKTHKEKRFRKVDEKDISKNEAFILSKKETRELYAKEFNKTSVLYFGRQPSFDEILEKINLFISRL